MGKYRHIIESALRKEPVAVQQALDEVLREKVAQIIDEGKDDLVDQIFNESDYDDLYDDEMFEEDVDPEDEDDDYDGDWDDEDLDDDEDYDDDPVQEARNWDRWMNYKKTVKAKGMLG